MIRILCTGSGTVAELPCPAGGIGRGIGEGDIEVTDIGGERETGLRIRTAVPVFQRGDKSSLFLWQECCRVWIACGEIGGPREPYDVYSTVIIDRNRISLVLAVPAKITEEFRCLLSRDEFGNKSIRLSPELRLECIYCLEVGILGESRYIDIAERIDGDSSALISYGTSQVGGQRECIARRNETGIERTPHAGAG